MWKTKLHPTASLCINPACWAQWGGQQTRPTCQWCTRPWTHTAGCDPAPWQQTSTLQQPGESTGWRDREVRTSVWGQGAHDHSRRLMEYLPHSLKICFCKKDDWTFELCQNMDVPLHSNKKLCRQPYIIGFLVRLHGLSDVLDSINGTADVRVFNDGRLKCYWGRGGLSRDVRDIKVRREDGLVLPLLGRPLHCWEEHDVGNCFDEDLELTRRQTLKSSISKNKILMGKSMKHWSKWHWNKCSSSDNILCIQIFLF